MTLKLPVDIGRAVLSGLGGYMIPITLLQTVAGERTPDALTAGRNTITTTTTFKGMVEEYASTTARTPVGDTVDMVKRGDRKILLLASSAPGVTPKPGDRIVAEGVTYVVIDIKRDPADATWQLQARGA